MDVGRYCGGVADYVFCLRFEDAANWEICKNEERIGVRTSPASHNSAAQLREGDIIYIWRGGGSRVGSGLIARARVAGPARPAVDVSWPDPSQYSYVVPVTAIEELPTAVPDRFPNNGRGNRFRIQNTDLQKGLRPVSAESSELLEECFSVLQSSEQSADLAHSAIATTGGGWSSDQDLIREVEQAAVAFGQAFLTSLGWRSIRDCQADGCGYDFLYEGSAGRQHKVEFKGTSGREARFLLTGKEYKVLSTDHDSVVVVITDALKDPKALILEWPAVVALGLRPDGWRVG